MTYTDQATKSRRPLVPGPGDASQKQQVVVRDREAQVNQARAGLQAGSGSMDRASIAANIAALTPPGPIGNLAGAIANVMASAGTIEKRGINKFHGYAYARMEDVLHALTPLMGQSGLAIIPNEVHKEIVEGNRLAVTFEFSIIHKSGERWPEKPRFTGMSMARDSKGNWDDKSVAKCATNARKYFLLSLFQLPAGDFPDPDEGEEANQRQQSVPGPGAPAPGVKEITPEARERASTAAQDEGIPHKITLPQGSGADQWASAFIKAIGKANSEAEVRDWDAQNSAILQHISEKFPGVYDMIETATRRRLEDLEAPDGSGPDPKTDPQAAINWIAAQLAQFQVYEHAETWWNQYIAPREAEFQVDDWELLMNEWKRTETRLLPALDDPRPQ